MFGNRPITLGRAAEAELGAACVERTPLVLGHGILATIRVSVTVAGTSVATICSAIATPAILCIGLVR